MSAELGAPRIPGDVIYVSYNSALLPLVQSQVIAYLAALHRASGERFRLVSFEPPAVWRRRGSPENAAYEARLREQGIEWTSLAYHARPSLLATLWDIAMGALVLRRMIRSSRPRFVHARSHVAAAAALAGTVGSGVPFLFDCRGLMADEYAEIGHWSPTSWKFRLTKRAEGLLFARASQVVVLTRRVRGLLVAGDRLPKVASSRITVIPCCVDLERFRVPAAIRRPGLTLCYLGSVGTWYLLPEMLDFVVSARRFDPALRLLVLNRDEHALLDREIRVRQIEDITTVRAADADEVPSLLATADAGIAFIRPSFAKQASSPTKFGEYLAAGLPIVTNPGVGDDEELLGGVAVFVRSFDADTYLAAMRELQGLVADRVATAERCRTRARDELSLELGVARYAEVYRRISGQL